MAKPTQAKHPTKADLPAVGYVRLALLLHIIPLSRATIWRKVKAGTFPKPLKLSEHAIAWKVEDVRAWIEAQNAQGKAA